MYSVTEQFVRWLTSLGYRASTVPPKNCTEFVTIERTGGNVADLVDHPEIAIQAWASDETRAEEMALAIRDEALLRSTPYGVTRMMVNAGPYPFWDEDTALPRYQIVFDVTCQLTD